MNSTFPVSVFSNSLPCSGLNLKSKFFLLITNLVPGPEKRELSQHCVQSLPVLLQLMYSASGDLSSGPAAGELSC